MVRCAEATIWSGSDDPVAIQLATLVARENLEAGSSVIIYLGVKERVFLVGPNTLLVSHTFF